MDEDDGGAEEAAGEGASAGPGPLDPARWYGEPGVCGSCIAWKPEDPRPDETVAAGVCRLRPELRRVPATLKLCSLYKPRGQFTYQPGKEPQAPTRRKRASAPVVLRRSEGGELVPASAPKPTRAERPERAERAERAERPQRGEGEVPALGLSFVPMPPRERPPPVPGWTPPKDVDVGTDSPPMVRGALVELIREELGVSRREMAQRFKMGGTAEAVSLDGRRRAIPASQLFSMLDRLKLSLEHLERALERRPGLGADREDLLANLRRVQGSFTTFNVLFADRADYFSGKE